MFPALIAASPLRLHALEEITGNRNAELRLPLPDKWGHGLMQQSLVPLVHDFLPLRRTASWAHGERDLAKSRMRSWLADPISLHCPEALLNEVRTLELSRPAKRVRPE